MEPARLTPARHIDDVILQPAAETMLVEDASEIVLTDLQGSNRMNSVREDAEGAIHFLLATSAKPAVLLAKAWHVTGVPFGFEHAALYQEVAAASNCFIVTIAKPEAGGMEHFLFAAKTVGLTDAEYLACIDDPTAVVEVVESHETPVVIVSESGR